MEKHCAKCWEANPDFQVGRAGRKEARELLLSMGRHPLRGVREAQEVFTIYT
jgi:hypothetical protein